MEAYRIQAALSLAKKLALPAEAALAALATRADGGERRERSRARLEIRLAQVSRARHQATRGFFLAAI